MFPLNIQPVEKVVHGDGQSLDVIEIFHTIQGEASFAGTPAVFLRLAGCVLQCPGCDTNYTANRFLADTQFVLQTIAANTRHNKTNLVVITGGEPLRQPIGDLVNRLLVIGYDVQIETSGSVYDGQFDLRHSRLSVVCSPKGKINDHLKPRITALKYVLSHDSVDETDGLPLTCLAGNVRPGSDPSLTTRKPERPWAGFCETGGRVFLQPMDTQDPIENKKNLDVCVRLCMTFGWTLSLQLHKICNLP